MDYLSSLLLLCSHVASNFSSCGSSFLFPWPASHGYAVAICSNFLLGLCCHLQVASYLLQSVIFHHVIANCCYLSVCDCAALLISLSSPFSTHSQLQFHATANLFWERIDEVIICQLVLVLGSLSFAIAVMWPLISVAALVQIGDLSAILSLPYCCNSSFACYLAAACLVSYLLLLSIQASSLCSAAYP